MSGSPLIPCLRYIDAAAAIDFLCDAFGFERRAIHEDADDPRIIHHAELVFGNAMVMLGSARDGEEESLYNWTAPRELGGVTAVTYVVVDDADAHCLRARNEGAIVVAEPHDNAGYPGRSYEALDPEGNVWNFGTYDPWAGFI